MQHLRPIFVLIIATALILAFKHFGPSTTEMLSAAPDSIADEPNVLTTNVQTHRSSLRPVSKFDRQRFDEIIKVLNRIPTGRTALSLVDKYDIEIHFEAGAGSYFNPNTNKIVVDANHEPARSALALVHEVTHAQYLHEGSAADILSDNRQEYIEKKVGEEVAGVVKSVEAKMELEAAGVDVSELRYTLEYLYQKAYEEAIENALANTPESSNGSLEAIGREAGRQAVFEGFMNGKTWTSVTKESYPDYYGQDWDRVNASL
jgi:phosphoribosyl-ATP pyrophosphohydrolase